jgi:hypothetical protein
MAAPKKAPFDLAQDGSDQGSAARLTSTVSGHPDRGHYAALGAIHQRWAAVPGRIQRLASVRRENQRLPIHTTAL